MLMRSRLYRSVPVTWRLISASALCCVLPVLAYIMLPTSPEQQFVLLSSAKIIDDAWQHQNKGDPITFLDFRGSDLDDQGLFRCKGLPIKHLVLDGTRITDAGLACLQGMQIEVLNLGATQISDQGLQYIRGMPLREVSLAGITEITNNGLAVLKEFSNLRRLDLSGTPCVRDTTLAYLQDMRCLQTLDLDSINITDEGLAKLAVFAAEKGMRLEHLELFNTHVTDEGLAHLQDMKSLYYLDVSCTKITDKGLVQLSSLSLTCLKLEGTKVTMIGLLSLPEHIRKGVVMPGQKIVMR